ncbi:DUF4303 domain-containing protein [Galactobacter caseinivorans]|uniref:DUF4303 domain-containing protein n=1 Tax=Galactobacter caseinivorans TaxID=2676123 RepID=A0A496PFH5_9MICC|nr:DUF4303 domain-containing protein [Galactobacter caseinivorans]RKW69479.1 DUF4303 domain-containing protein [Galactobacter caseinivorans]
MGLDWTALEQGLQRVATQKAAAIMAEHEGHSFYGLALHGVPTEEDGELVLPVLALNSEEALARDLSDEPPVDSEDDDFETDPEAEEWSEPPLDGSDPPDPEEDAAADDAEASAPGAVEETGDDELDLDADVDTDDSTAGFYSRRWDPGEWHWNAVDLVESAAAGVWERAFAAEVQGNGWETTALRYYGLMVRVVQAVRQDLEASGGKELVCFVADDDHAERLLRASLTAEQLERHFPELVAN